MAISGFCLMAVGMGMTMAPATESVMGSLPREKAGVGSAVNDTTRQVGGALGVAVIGSVVSSIYASNVDDLAGQLRRHRRRRSTQARASLGGALEVGSAARRRRPAFIDGVKDGFVDALSNGLRLSSLIILGAAFVAWRFLPARARDPLAVDAAPADARRRRPGRRRLMAAAARRRARRSARPPAACRRRRGDPRRDARAARPTPAWPG